jgi:hypothetical protein
LSFLAHLAKGNVSFAFTDSVFPVPAGPVNRVKVVLYTILYLIPDINYENETKVSCRITENISR